MTPEQMHFANRIMNRADRAVRRWGTAEETDSSFHITITVKEDGTQYLLTQGITLDGAEAFAEFNLRDTDADMRDAARKIQREQLNKVKITNHLADRIIQYGIFGEVQL